VTNDVKKRRRRKEEPEDNPFQRAIKRIWKGLAAQTGQDEADLKYDLLLELIERGLQPAYKADQDTNILDTWSRGNVPPDWNILRFLAGVGYTRAKLPDSWVEEFLESANYPRESIPLIQAEMREELAEIDRGVLHNLPQRDLSRFVGRREELAELRRLLSPEGRAWVITVDGIGGVGKSELVLELADRLRQEYPRLRRPERFQAIVWVTAKETGLSDTGVLTQVRRQQSSLDDIYTTIARVLGRLDILEVDDALRGERVYEALSSLRTLLIIDNLENLKDGAVLSFIREMPSPSKVIVTTRHRIDVAYAIRLTGLSAEDSALLIAKDAALKGVSLTEEQSAELYSISRGVPIVITLVISRLALGLPFKSAVQYLDHPENDLYHYVLKDSVDSIASQAAAYHMLLALALCANDAPRKALGTAAGLEGDDLERDEALAQLEKLSLVNRDTGNDRFSLLPLVRHYLLARLRDDLDLRQRLFDGLVAYYKDRFKADESNNHRRYWQSIPEAGRTETILEEEWGTLRDILFQLYEAGAYQELLTLGLALIHPLNYLGSLKDRLELCQRMAEAARALDDPVEAWLRMDGIGWMYHRLEQYSDFLDALDAGRLVATRHEGMAMALTLADIHEAYVHIKQGDLARAKALLDAAGQQLAAYRQSNPDDYIGYILGSRYADRWSSYYQETGDFDRASKKLAESIKLRTASQEDVGSAHYNVGRLRLLANDLEGAHRAFTGSLNYPHHQKYRALSRYGLALVAARQENWPEAGRQARQALLRLEQLGMDQEAAEVKDFLETFKDRE
jgi:LuxR family glucitol operon transcriptional activator